MAELISENRKLPSERSKTLVTGGTGFVGRAVVVALLAQGRPVRVLARNPKHPALAGLPVEVAPGDLRDRVSLELALEGCSQLFHVAADYRLWVPDPEEMYAVNVEGTRNLLAAAQAQGVSRVVYTSTVGALGNPGDGTPGREDTPVRLQDMVGHYKRSKFLAEAVALEFAAGGLPLTVVNPSTPMGPWDWRPTPTGQIIVDFLQGRMPAYLETGLNMIHVDDVARGHLLAEARGQVGEKYILGNANLSLSQILQMLAEISGRPAPRVKLPYWPVLALAYVDEFFTGRLRGKTPRMPVTAIRMARKYMYFDNTKAVKYLGLTLTPVRQALTDAVEWFREYGYV
jgi:dihydroflavonol-4-reductase